MLDRLRAIFRVKETQDFRNLYTDPPISFADRFPEVPPPDNDLTPQILAARWTMDDLRGEDMPSIAANLLEAGQDAPSLRRLAGEINITHSKDIEALVTKVLKELSAQYPLTSEEAMNIYTRQVAREVIAGKRNPWVAASYLSKGLWRLSLNDLNLELIAELLDSLDWDDVNHDRLPQKTHELIEAFARLGAKTEREKQLASSS
jgi:DNA-binding transcriptional regulator YhcF (GntR family)